MPAQTFNITNSGTESSLLDRIEFDTPNGLSHSADLTLLGGPSNFTGNSFNVTAQTIEAGQFKSFSVDYQYVSGAAGTRSGTISAHYVSGQICSAQTTINVTLTPAPPPPAPPPPPPGSFVFEADYIQMKTTFTNGTDLDIRVAAVLPVGVGTKYIGYGSGRSESDWLNWGGDNTGVGSEAVLFDAKKFKLAHPSVDELKIDFRCWWFGSTGTNPVSLSMDLWKGGNPVLSNFSWTNSSAEDTQSVTSSGKTISKHYSSGGVAERLAVLTYNFTTGTGSISTTDTTTNSL